MDEQLLNEEQRKALRIYQEYEKLWNIIERTQPLDDDSTLLKDLQGMDEQYTKQGCIDLEQNQKIERDQRIDSLTDEIIESIRDIEKYRGHKLLVFICHQPISFNVSLELNEILQKNKHLEHLDILLDSDGGNIDSAYKILNLFKSYADKTTVIVPAATKNAATLIALGADELIICKAGELGPVDPQVMDPQTGTFVSAHSIRDAVNFIKEIKDPLMKIKLTDKLSPFLVGAYRESEKSCRQYLEHTLSKKQIKDKDEMIKIFTKKFLSHGYPMDREFLLQSNIAVAEHDDELESKIYDLYEKYMQVYENLYSKYPKRAGSLLLVQTSDEQLIKLENETLSDLIVKS